MNKLLGTILLAVGLGAPSVSHGQEREDRISRTIDVGPTGELSISNISGDISVEATSGGEIVIEAVKRLHGGADRTLLDEVKVDISHTSIGTTFLVYGSLNQRSSHQFLRW